MLLMTIHIITADVEEEEGEQSLKSPSPSPGGF